MALISSAGSKLFIGTAKASASTDFTAADFAAMTWTEIAETESLGTIGDSAETVDFTSHSDARKRTLKTIRSAGNMELVCGLDPSDAGQIALIAAEKTKSEYAFKLEFSDAPTAGTPSQRLFVALVMSATETIAEATGLLKLNSTLTINSNIVRVAASA